MQFSLAHTPGPFADFWEVALKFPLAFHSHASFSSFLFWLWFWQFPQTEVERRCLDEQSCPSKEQLSWQTTEKKRQILWDSWCWGRPILLVKTVHLSGDWSTQHDPWWWVWVSPRYSPQGAWTSHWCQALCVGGNSTCVALSMAEGSKRSIWLAWCNVGKVFNFTALLWHFTLHKLFLELR